MIRFPFSKPRDDAAKTEADEADPERQEATQDGSTDAPEDAEAAVDALEAEAEREFLDEPEAREDSGYEGGHRFLHIDDDSDALEDADRFEAGGRSGAPDMEEQVRMVEAMLFASERPLSTAELASRMPIGCDAAVAVRRLEEMYAGRGVTLARVAGKWAFRTAADLAWLLTGEAVEQRRLSRAAIETLAIIAYHQPVTRAEIEEIRQVGVSKGTIDLLMELQWVKLGRRRQTPGRPVTFVTTDLFLETFGLESTKDLPRLDELRQAGLLESRPPVGLAPGLVGEDEDGEEPEEDEDDREEPDLLL